MLDVCAWTAAPSKDISSNMTLSRIENSIEILSLSELCISTTMWKKRVALLETRKLLYGPASETFFHLLARSAV